MWCEKSRAFWDADDNDDDADDDDAWGSA